MRVQFLADHLIEPANFRDDEPLLPTWTRIVYTLFLCALMPVYWIEYGPQNFLWWSDVALIGAGIAMWLESPLIASMMAVAVVVPETLWNASFFSRLFLDNDPVGIASYMFDPKNSELMRALSLFHVPLPAMLLWLVHRLGYDRRALAVQTLFAWALLSFTYVFTDASRNINWLHGFYSEQRWMPPLQYFFLILVAYPIVLYVPTHLVLRACFHEREQPKRLLPWNAPVFDPDSLTMSTLAPAMAQPAPPRKAA